MVFSSLTFLFFFLPACLIIYFLVPPIWLKNTIIFIFSLIFYAWGELIYIVLMLFSTVLDYTMGFLVQKFSGTKKAKIFLIISIVTNISMLCFFKYTDFFLDTFNLIFRTKIPLLNLSLPIGISFYTFQTMSYTIDIYRGQKAQKNILSFGAYVTMFPQLVAGPIVRYGTIAKELVLRNHTLKRIFLGAKIFVIGLAKKVLLANTCGEIFSLITNNSIESISTLSAIIAFVAYGFQIYFDFSGYSDMAIGLGHIFGFTFPINFNYPYESKSCTEFWRRWHITLGTWFREYIYIPLGGNRVSFPRQFFNIAVVWLLTGFWHGSAFNFILWGVYFCILLIIEKLFLLKLLKKLPRFVGIIYTLVAVFFSWILFSIENLSDVIIFAGKVIGIGVNSFCDNLSIYTLVNSAILFIIAAIGCTKFPKILAKIFMFKCRRAKAFIITIECVFIASLFILSIAYIVSGSYNPFLYFRF